MIAASMTPVIIIGGGGHGRVVIDALKAAGHTIAGVVDRDPSTEARLSPGIRYLGGDDALDSFNPNAILLANGFGSIGRVDNRRRIFEQLSGRGFRFATVRHPSAIVAFDVQLGEGAQIMAGAVVQTGARIGKNVIVNTSASVDHDCEIGMHSHIAPGVVLSGGVQIGAACHVGTGAMVIQGIVIGTEVVIGAGAVVITNVEPGVSFVGRR